MLGHREKHTQKETWHLYKLVSFYIYHFQSNTKNKNKDHKMISGDSLSTLFEIAVASEIHSPRKRFSQLPLKATLFNPRKMTEII